MLLEPIPSTHAAPLTCPLDPAKAEELPSGGFCCPHHQRYYLSPDFSQGPDLDFAPTCLYHASRRLWPHDPARSPLLPCWLSRYSAPPTPEGSSKLHFQNLHLFHGLHVALHTRLPLVPLAGLICQRCRIPLYGTDYRLAPPSQEDTALHHTPSPGCSGSLLRGSLVITSTGLSPASHQNLSRHTMPLL